MSTSTDPVSSQNPSSEENPQKNYEILSEDNPNYDLSFKVIIIGNSGNFNFI